MTDLSLAILPEREADAGPIERLHERAFGPGRYAKSAYRVREKVVHCLNLSFTAWVESLLVGSVRLSPIRVGTAKALLLGPLTVEPAFRSQGVGEALMKLSLDAARIAGHGLVLLVGDEEYYGRVGFARAPLGKITMPGPVDPKRLLYFELREGALAATSGRMRRQ